MFIGGYGLFANGCEQGFLRDGGLVLKGGRMRDFHEEDRFP